MAPTKTRVRTLAKKQLGFAELRAGQLEGVMSVLAGHDTLCVMSTGHGKSAIYQIAGLLLDGPTVVISPLIALQRDQVESIEDDRAAHAAVLNSTLSARAREKALEDAGEGEITFLLMAPEQVVKEEVIAELREARPALFVVDEAHCVSQWGHDFRPDYLRLANAIEAVGRPPVLALTATAAPPVREDIVTELRLRDPRLIVRGFDRPNIHLEARRFHDESRKREALLAAVAEAEPPGIVYVATRKATEELAEQLQAAGVAARAYHGGMSAGRRDQVQEQFMNGGCDVIVATVAFGMGVDKHDVRWIFHEQVSDSLDSYYQEIGRAGRDGAPARAVLFYRPEDVGLRRFFASGGADREQIEQVAAALPDVTCSVAPEELLERVGVSRTRLATALHRLEETGAVEVGEDGRVRRTTSSEQLGQATDAAAHAEDDRRAFDRSRIEMMRAYAERTACRREFLLGYFGEDFTPPCDNCDNCDRGLTGAGDCRDSTLETGQHVIHPEWGEGIVGTVGGGQITVVFDSVGYKTLDLGLVAERRLLAPVSSR